MTKITRLSPTEVANNGPLPFTRKRSNLESIEDPNVFWGYDPVRRALASLFRVRTGLFDDEEFDEKKQLLALAAACKNPTQKKACSASARALLKWRDENKVRAIAPEVAPIPYKTPVDELQFANSNVFIVRDELHLVFFDPRSSLNLTSLGQEFVKSLMWHAARIGDLRSAKIALLQTPSSGKDQRTVRFDVLEGDPKYSLDQIDDMVLETYRVWEIILRARRAAEGQGAADGDGFL